LEPQPSPERWGLGLRIQDRRHLERRDFVFHAFFVILENVLYA